MPELPSGCQDLIKVAANRVGFGKCYALLIGSFGAEHSSLTHGLSISLGPPVVALVLVRQVLMQVEGDGQMVLDFATLDVLRVDGCRGTHVRSSQSSRLTAGPRYGTDLRVRNLLILLKSV